MCPTRWVGRLWCSLKEISLWLYLWMIPCLHSGSLPNSIARRFLTWDTATSAAAIVLSMLFFPLLKPTTTLPGYVPASVMNFGPKVSVAGASAGLATVYTTYAEVDASYEARSCVVPPMRIGGHVPVRSFQLARHWFVDETLVKYDGNAKNSNEIPMGAGSRGAYEYPLVPALLGTAKVTAASAPWMAAAPSATRCVILVMSKIGRRAASGGGLSGSRPGVKVGRARQYLHRSPVSSRMSLGVLATDVTQDCYPFWLQFFRPGLPPAIHLWFLAWLNLRGTRSGEAARNH